jgi:hypothetical protein
VNPPNTAIHLFFHNWRFWTRQNDCIPLTAMHSFCCVKPSNHAGLRLRLIAHNVQNALTSSYCSQNYTAIHLFFRNWRFWTHQNDCIALSTMHSFCCVKPFTHAGLTLRLIAHNVQNALASSYCSQIYTAIHLFFHNWRFWTRQNDCIALTAMHSFRCVKPFTHSRRTHTSLDRPQCTECIDIILLQPNLHCHSSILSQLMFLDTSKWLYSSVNHAFVLLC